ncbi:MAG: DNA polymerase III subunit delta [Candidatus Koribacter versatilis]|uniref:DNA polymerase III subunit delta n=1 Tax=Candidatus Korobacter versatilis TaxID=658062 RepID=A0A932EP15_9BACT|nr:DNA polymerase III subunit delta [Candidatus Koribacter versatilis]
MAGRFAPTERFVSEVKARKLAPAYLFIGDEGFFRDRCRAALIEHLVPRELREFSFYELDLAEVEVAEVLDRARTPSLMAPFQVFFIRNVKALYGRGSHQAEFDAIEQYVKSPNPDAVLIFVADHIAIPADVRKMELQDKDRYERIRETLGEYCTVIEFARVDESEGMRWVVDSAGSQGVKVETDAARELVDSLGADMLLVANELEKLFLFVGEKKRVTLADVETMVLAAKQRSLYELTDAISAKDRPRALATLDAILSSGDGDEAAIGHLHMLAKTFRQMLVILEKNVRDSRAIWQALWQGFRVPPFAAEDIIRQARRYKSRRDLTRALRLIAKADLALRSNPVSKRLVLEKLVLDLCADAKPAMAASLWQQEELPV